MGYYHQPCINKEIMKSEFLRAARVSCDIKETVASQSNPLFTAGIRSRTPGRSLKGFRCRRSIRGSHLISEGTRMGNAAKMFFLVNVIILFAMWFRFDLSWALDGKEDFFCGEWRLEISFWMIKSTFDVYYELTSNSIALLGGVFVTVMSWFCFFENWVRLEPVWVL